MTARMKPTDSLSFHSSIDEALARAGTGLGALQTEQGSFPGDLNQGTSATAQTLITERFLGVLDPAEAQAAVRWLSEQVRRDGSVPAYPGADFGSLMETSFVLGALAAAGVPSSDPLRRRLQGWIDSRGGFRALDPLTLTYLAMASLFPVSALPKMPIEHALIPGMSRYIGRTFVAYFGLALPYFLPGLIHGMQFQGQRIGRIAQAARGRIIDHVLSLQNPEGNWIGSQWATTMALSCLFALGLPITHDAVSRGLESLGRLKRRVSTPSGEGHYVIAIDGSVWNTAMALRVLTRAGTEGYRKGEANAQQAVEYLLASQSATPAPQDWLRVAPGSPRSGGWSFEPGNVLLLDTDTTAMAMMALADHAESARIRSAILRGQQWLLALQNDDGGFAAFTRNQRTAPPSAMFGQMPAMPVSLKDRLQFMTKPPDEFVDMPTADLTGRVLSALGRMGFRRDNPAVSRAVRFTYGQRTGDIWWGRWTTNYLAATSFVLPGLIATGEDKDSEPVRRAVDWILAHQNEDGGFGESNQTYANPSLAGQGPSNAYLSGLVLQALCAVGHAQGSPAARIADYLCRSQRPDGLWDENQAVQMMAAEMFYKNFVNFQTAPIEGLAIYRDAVQGTQAVAAGEP